MTFISVLVFLSLILFMFEMNNSYRERGGISEYNMHMSRLSYALDDLSTDLSEIYGIKYSATFLQNHTVQSFQVESVERSPYLQLSDYEDYLNTTYRQKTHSNLTFSIARNVSQISCNNRLYLLRNYSSNETYVYFNKTGIYNASITLYVYSDYVNGIPWFEFLMETPVHFKASSMTGTDVNQLYHLRKAINNRYRLNYTDGELNVEFGDVGKGVEGVYIWGAPEYDVNITLFLENSTSTSISCHYTDSQFSYAQDIMNESGSIDVAAYPMFD